MRASLLFVASLLAAPPQSTLPPRDLCACADCKCRIDLPKQTVEPPPIKASPKPHSFVATNGKTYVLKADGKYWLATSPPATTTPPATPTLSSGCPGGVCPVPGIPKGWR